MLERGGGRGRKGLILNRIDWREGDLCWTGEGLEGGEGG